MARICWSKISFFCDILGARSSAVCYNLFRKFIHLLKQDWSWQQPISQNLNTVMIWFTAHKHLFHFGSQQVTLLLKLSPSMNNINLEIPSIPSKCGNVTGNVISFGVKHCMFPHQTFEIWQADVWCLGLVLKVRWLLQSLSNTINCRFLAPPPLPLPPLVRIYQ